MALASVTFFALALIAIASAVGVLIARSPIYSALSLVLNLLSVAGLYLTMNASFIGVIQILVYAGAIMVLVLFVIMLLNLDALPSPRSIGWGPILGFVLGTGLLAQLLYVMLTTFGISLEAAEPVTTAMAVENGSANTLGQILFTEYALHLQVAAILLLAATVGAVMLAQRRFA
jgi:NADH-quinone oxidoreductase subunit J